MANNINSDITKNYYPNTSVKQKKESQNSEKLKTNKETISDTILKNKKREIFDNSKTNYQSTKHINYDLIPDLKTTNSLNNLQKKANVYVALIKKYPIDKPYIEPSYFQDLVKEATINTLKIQLQNDDKVNIDKKLVAKIDKIKVDIKNIPQDKAKAKRDLDSSQNELIKVQKDLNNEIINSKKAMQQINLGKKTSINMFNDISNKKDLLIKNSGGISSKRPKPKYDIMNIDPKMYTFDRTIIDKDKKSYNELKALVDKDSNNKINSVKLNGLKNKLIKEITEAKKVNNPNFYNLEQEFFSKNPNYWIDRNDRSVNDEEYNKYIGEIKQLLDLNKNLKTSQNGLNVYTKRIEDLSALEKKKGELYKKNQKNYSKFNNRETTLNKKLVAIEKLREKESKENIYIPENLSRSLSQEILSSANNSTELLSAGREGFIKGYQEFRNLSNKQYPEYSYLTANKTLKNIDEHMDGVRQPVLDTKI